VAPVSLETPPSGPPSYYSMQELKHTGLRWSAMKQRSREFYWNRWSAFKIQMGETQTAWWIHDPLGFLFHIRRWSSNYTSLYFNSTPWKREISSIYSSPSKLPEVGVTFLSFTCRESIPCTEDSSRFGSDNLSSGRHLPKFRKLCDYLTFVTTWVSATPLWEPRISQFLVNQPIS